MAKQIKYTDAFRREAVAMYQKSNESASQVARKLGIHEHTMCRWLELYGRDMAAPAQSVSAQAISPEGCDTSGGANTAHPQALGYIHAIERYVGALEQLLLQQSVRDSAKE